MSWLNVLPSTCLLLQEHYDFGMRALKAVLMMAGGLKRARKQDPEAVVVIRAIRDANLPKLLTDVGGTNWVEGQCWSSACLLLCCKCAVQGASPFICSALEEQERTHSCSSIVVWNTSWQRMDHMPKCVLCHQVLC